MRILFVSVLLVFACAESSSADSLSVGSVKAASLSKSVKTIEDSQNINEFLKQNGNTGLLPALKLAQVRYEAAIQLLANRMAKCQSKEFDGNWRPRAVKKFGVVRFKKLEKDLKLAIGAKYYSNFMSCEKDELSAALYSEANLLPLLFELGDELKDFRKKSAPGDLEASNAAIAYIDILRATRPTPLQMIVNPSIELKTVGKATSLEEDVKEFIDTEPAFKGNFQLSAAIKSVQQ